VTSGAGTGIDLFVYAAAEFESLRTAHPSMRKAVDSGIDV